MEGSKDDKKEMCKAIAADAEPARGDLLKTANGVAFIHLRIQTMLAEAAVLAAQYRVTLNDFLSMATQAHEEIKQRLITERDLVLVELSEGEPGEISVAVSGSENPASEGGEKT